MLFPSMIAAFGGANDSDSGQPVGASCGPAGFDMSRLARPGSYVLLPSPTYSSYGFALNLCGYPVIFNDDSGGDEGSGGAEDDDSVSAEKCPVGETSCCEVTLSTLSSGELRPDRPSELFGLVKSEEWSLSNNSDSDDAGSPILKMTGGSCFETGEATTTVTFTCNTVGIGGVMWPIAACSFFFNPRSMLISRHSYVSR